MRDTIDMAREAGYMRTVHGGAEVSMASMDCLKRLEALIRADERSVEREAIEDLLKEYDMDTSSFAKEFRARAVGNRSYDRYEGETT